MANSKDVAVNSAAAPNNGTENWIQIQDHRPMYLPDECGRAPVRGYLLGTMEMNPSNKNVKADVPLEDQYWVAIVFLLTAPCKAKSPEGDVRDYPPGTQILVGGADMSSLYTRADDRVVAYEVVVEPTKPLQLGGGRRMWLFEKRVNPATVDRKANRLEFLEGRASELDSDPFNGAKQLPDHRTAPALPADNSARP